MSKLDQALSELVEQLALSDIHRGSFDLDHPKYGRWKVSVTHKSPGREDPGGRDPDKLEIE